MEVNEIKLSFEVPKMTTYPLFSGVLGILAAHGIADNWVMYNYIQMWSFHEFEKAPYWTDFKFGNDDDFHNICKCIDQTVIKRSEVGNDIIQILQQKIVGGNYIYVSLNMYYIDSWWKNGEEKQKAKHQVLIHGFNENGFLMADFFSGKYQSMEIAYGIFLKAYDTFEEVNDVDVKHCVNINYGE